jgi:hypothetical protein
MVSQKFHRAESMNLAMLCVIAQLVCALPLALAAGPESRAAPGLEKSRWQYVGVEKCALCHYRQETKAGQLGEEIISTDFVRLTEVATWLKDKHAAAYSVLSKDLGLQMGKALGITSAKEPRCVSCHGMTQNGALAPLRELVRGVSCESCHGPGGDWWVPHSETTWRTKPSSEKQRLGMIDLRDPAVKIRQCMGCHIGNAGQGKMVTHEMYAAGHPPLPSFEIETFLRDMPQHWTNPGAKPERIRRSLRYDPKEMARTKSVLLGGVLALREWLKIVAVAGKPEGGWPDFALYECYGCHHHLDPNLPTWRQSQGYRGVAGGLNLADWPRALVKLAIFHTAQNPEAYRKRYQEFSAKLRNITGGRPAGGLAAYDSKHGAIGELVAWLDKLAGEVERSRFDRNATARLLHRLSVLKEPEDADSMGNPDYYTARQIAWAMASLYKDLQSGGERYPEIEKLIGQIQNVVDLKLPGKKPAAAAYKPERFRDPVRRLSALLQP